MYSRWATSTSLISENSVSIRLPMSFVTATCWKESSSSNTFRVARTPSTIGIKISSQKPRRIFCCAVQSIRDRNPLFGLELPANQPCGALHSLDQQYLLHIVNLLQLHFDDLVLSRLDHSSDIPSLDGKFAPAAIDQHTELDACRTTLIEERVKSGANCAPSVQDVIEEDNVFAGDTEVDFGVIEDRLHA